MTYEKCPGFLMHTGEPLPTPTPSHPLAGVSDFPIPASLVCCQPMNQGVIHTTEA